MLAEVTTSSEIAGEAEFTTRRGGLFEHAIPPEVVRDLEPPATWVEREAPFPPGWLRAPHLDGELLAP